MNYEEVVIEALAQAKRIFHHIRASGQCGDVVGIGASGDTTLFFDKALEDGIIAILQERLGRCLIVSEEAGIVGDPSSNLTALVDPLDGSTNARHGLPIQSSSIAIAEGKRFTDIKAAGIIDLVNGEVITAFKGEGCRIDGREAHPSMVEELNVALISLSLRVKGGQKNDPTLLANLLNTIRHPRMLGTAALETAYVAVGRVDAFIEPYPRLRVYDCLPSLFLVKEAKAPYRFIGRADADLDLRSTSLIGYVAAGCKILLEKIMRLIS